MSALGDLVSCDEHPKRAAFRTGGSPAREYDYRRFRSTARKTGNFLRHLGVSDGATVAVADDPAPEAVFAFLGTALLGGTTRFGPPCEVDARVVVAPTGRLGEFSLPPGGQFVGYGAPTADPSHHQFERDVWSENPGFPATAVDPDSPALRDDRRDWSHAELLAAADEVAAGLEPADVVAVRAPLSSPGAVVAGLLAPLLAGACVLLPGERADTAADSDDATGTVAVVADDDARTPEPQQVVIGEVC